MGLFKRKCGYASTSPFRVKCTREMGHSGLHSARGMRWDADGRIRFASGGRRQRRR
jgi:hypothetical protein